MRVYHYGFFFYVSNFILQLTDKKLSNKCLYDFVCLLYAYDEIVPNATTKRIRYKELNDFFTDRMVKNKDWFSKNDTIASSYRFAKKVLDNFLEV